MKNVLNNIFCLLVSIILIFSSLEIFLRVNPKFGYIYNSFRESYSAMKDYFQVCALRPSELLGYENIPNCGRINSYGLVGKEYKLQKEKNTFRILLLGDSIAWQDYSRQFLEESLNSNALLRAKYKFEIWNAGCPGYDNRRYALYLQHKGLMYKPDMVMIFLFMNDYYPDAAFYYKDANGIEVYSMPLREVSKRFTVNRFLVRKSYLYRFVMLKIDSYLINKKRQKGFSSQEEDGEFYMHMIQDMCKKNHIQLFAAIFPYLKPLNEYANYQKNEYNRICKMIKDFNIDHVNLYDQLPERGLYGLRETKEDEIHPSKEGHILIGKIIYNYLLDKYFHGN